MTKLNINKWDKFNKLTIIKEILSEKSYRIFLCKCECWKEKNIAVHNLTHWATRSCWCLIRRPISHWFSHNRIYTIWAMMKQRCINVNHEAYNRYWWRWIKCEWEIFENFKEDMYESYLEHKKIHWTKNTTLDRRNNDWNYCKDNCKWATKKEQANNTRVSVNYTLRKYQNIFKKDILKIFYKKLIEFNWKSMSLSNWCRYLHLDYSIVSSRISVMKWNKLEALELIKREKTDRRKF